MTCGPIVRSGGGATSHYGRAMLQFRDKGPPPHTSGVGGAPWRLRSDRSEASQTECRSGRIAA